MKIKSVLLICAIFFSEHNLYCQFVPVPIRIAEPAAAAAVIQTVLNANLFEFIFGMPWETFLGMMPLDSEGSRDPLLALSTDHVVDVRNRRFFLTTSTGNYGCGRSEVLSHQDLIALTRLRFQRSLGWSLRTGHVTVVEAVNLDETSPYWHYVGIPSLMAARRNRGAVFQVFECRDRQGASFAPSCIATLPACIYRRFFNESVPGVRSLVYQHGVQVVYGQPVDGGRVCVREHDQIIDLAVCRAFVHDDDQLAELVLTTYQAAFQAAFIKGKNNLFLTMPDGIPCEFVAQALQRLEPLIADSGVEVTLVWHSTGDARDDGARAIFTQITNKIGGDYNQYRPDGMYQWRDEPYTPLSAVAEHATGVTSSSSSGVQQEGLEEPKISLDALALL